MRINNLRKVYNSRQGIVTLTILLTSLPLACRQVATAEETPPDEKNETAGENGPVSVTKSGEPNSGIQGGGIGGGGVPGGSKPTTVPPKSSDGGVGTGDSPNDTGGHINPETSGSNDGNTAGQATPEWRTAWLSIPRIGAGAAFSGHKVHVLGGSANRDNIDVYDTLTKTWSVEARYNEGIWISSTTVAGKAVFSGGDLGSGPSNRMLFYDGAVDTWSEIRQPVGGYSRAIAVLGEKIFLAGGLPAVNYIYSYDLNTEEWKNKYTPTPRLGVAGAAAGGKVMFAGGFLPAGTSCASLIEIYDQATDTWTSATLSSAKGYVAGVAARNLIFFAGGGCVGGESYNDVVDIYNTDTNSWSRATLSEARSGIGVGVVGNKVVFAGGSGIRGGQMHNGGATDTVDIYDLDSGAWSTARLSAPRALPTVVSTGEELLIIGGEGLHGSSSAVDIYSPR